MLRIPKIKAVRSILALAAGIGVLALGLALAIETGEIKGKVADDTGAGLPGVEITAASPSLQGTRTILSSKDGNFHFPLLPVGTYKLTFKLQGFDTVIQEKVIVRLGMVTGLDVVMTMAAIHKEVTVTAETPLIDKTSTDTSYYLSAADLDKNPAQNRTVVDAVKFTPGVTGVRMNTRRGTATEGQPSFRGEGEEGNTWIVDGLAISGVRLKNSGTKLNYDSLDEIQVISDPFSPEFGSAYGGIINMVTKSGSNEFRGEFSLVFMDKNLQAARQEQLSVVSEPNDFSNANWYFNLGGPILKDKLWFFISENYYTNTERTKAGTVDYFQIPGGEKTTGNNNLFTKLTYSFNNNHNVSLTAIYDKSFKQKGWTGIPELDEEKTYRDVILRSNYKGILNGSTFIEAGLGFVNRENLKTPTDRDLGPAQYFIEDLAQNIRNSYGNVTDNEKRMDFSFKFTKYFETETFGHHEVNLGLEYYDFSSNFTSEFSGTKEDIFPGDGFDNGTKYHFDTWKNGQGTPTLLREYGNFSFVNSSRGIGLYFKDKILWDRFTLMVGVRSQTQTCRDDQGKSLWSWGLDDFISPRFSLTVDLTKDGKNVLKLAWGRFSDLITTMPLGFFNAGGSLTYRDFIWKGTDYPSESEVHNPSNWEKSWEQPAQRFEVAEGVRPNFQSRFLVEFGRRIARDWAVKARYVHSNSENLLEALMVIDLSSTQGYKLVYDNFELKRRNYDGFEIELNGKIGQNFYLNASYSHALAKGTNPGQTETGAWSQEEGSTNFVGLFGKHMFVPNLPGLEETKAKVDFLFGGLGGRDIGDEGWYGKLPYSIDHNVKTNLAYLAPHGVLVSAAFEYISGYYWEKLGYVPGFGGYYSFPEGRGSRKTPAHSYLDLSLEKTFRIGSLGVSRNTALSVRMDLFNVLNSQQPIAYVKENIPVFGTIWGRQQSRQARVSAKLKF
jgi:Carboxypeptidase regulatory-like domain/TonB-dependent Receptor Plug Domain